MREVWIAEELDAAPVLDDIERLAARRKVPVLLVPRGRLEHAARTEAPQGVLARAGALAETDLDATVRADRKEPRFCWCSTASPIPTTWGRCCEVPTGAGVTGVVFPRHRAAHVTPTVAKVAAGAVEHLDFAVVPGIPSALQRLEEKGVITVGLDAGASLSLYDVGKEVGESVALVLGSESKGLAALTRRRCTLLVSIPQRGALSSLNVAAAGAVACFELARRRSASP